MATSKVKPKEVVIKHGLFFYHEPAKRIVAGEEKDVLVERMAFHGETVTLTREADIQKGEEHGAFYSDEELKDREAPGQEVVAESEEGSRPVSELENDELVDWLMSTGEFDGQKKPTATEVVEAAGDDQRLAERLLDAEETASGGNPRKSVVDGLDPIINDDEDDDDDDEEEDENG